MSHILPDVYNQPRRIEFSNGVILPRMVTLLSGLALSWEPIDMDYEFHARAAEKYPIIKIGEFKR